jgi:''chromo'' (CHRromatin Organisation MOdifier) domain./Integrase core domain.
MADSNFIQLDKINNYGNEEEPITDEKIIKDYTTPGHPIAYSGIQNVYSYYNRQVPLLRIKKLLSGNEGYTLHKEFHKQQRNITYKHYKRYQFQMDLVEVQHLSSKNDGVRYLLNCIDIFTRFAFVRPLKDKTANSVLTAFKSILQEAVTPPYMVVMDKGAEFTNNAFREFCNRVNIKFINPQASVHAAFIERFNRTLQLLMYKYMTDNETERYIDVLPKLVFTYNNRMHRMIKTTPQKAESNNNGEHLNLSLIQQEQLKKIKTKKPNLAVGSYVRIAKQKGKFSRSYDEQTMQEIFKIKSVDTNKPIPLYHLTDYDGKEDIVGGFYEFELTPIETQIFRIEKVLKKRTYRGKRQVFVKWKGFRDSHNSWIDETNIERNF